MALSARQSDFEQLYTAEEFQTLPQFGERYELLDGRLVEKLLPGYRHSVTAFKLLKAYILFDPAEAVGRFIQEVSTVLSLRNVPAPDLAFWQTANIPAMTDKAAPRPDLAVEIWSPHDFKTQKRRAEAENKIKKYQAAGVALVWLIDPRSKTVRVYQPQVTEPVATLGLDDILDGGTIIPGFKIAVKTLFE